MKLFPGAILATVFSITMFTPLPLLASEFSDSYKAYNEAVAAKNTTDIELYAVKAYELGKVKFSTDSLDIAMLALNAGNALIANLPEHTRQGEAAVKAKKSSCRHLRYTRWHLLIILTITVKRELS